MTLCQPLTLVVLNSEQLDINSHVQHQFDQHGGTLGASDKDHWQLRDRLGAVLPEHARIDVTDGHFSLCDLSGQSFINGSLSPIGRGRWVRLSQGDELTIGPFRLGVYTDDPMQDRNIEQRIGLKTDGGIDRWLNEATPPPPDDQDKETAAINDPLWVLQREQCHQLLHADGTEADASLPAALTSLCAAEDTMDQKFVELPAINHPLSEAGGEENLNQAALAALMRGLGVSLSITDAAGRCAMLEEMGKSLRAAIEGLLTLQQGQGALADTHLRPIEDNPLCLGLDYVDTLPLMFAEEKSPVHLAAPAAVAEILNNVRVHQAANQLAIVAALESILHAFSPVALLQRFEHYRRSGEVQQADEGWAWQMYQHYYRELTSVRQQGFQKLFQQVYTQSYDRAVRQQQEQQ